MSEQTRYRNVMHHRQYPLDVTRHLTQDNWAEDTFMYCCISCIFQRLYVEELSRNTRHLSQDSWTEDTFIYCGISCILQSLYIDVLRRTTRHMNQDSWAEQSRIRSSSHINHSTSIYRRIICSEWIL
jgi:hypothetical protein